jgi:amidophosphoribosyltransferase
MDGILKEKCGIVGIWGHPEAANLAYLGLYALQHRGQEGAGIASCFPHGGRMNLYKGKGLVADIFRKEALEKLPGSQAIGHTRYSTCGAKEAGELQPLMVDFRGQTIAVAHNGNLINYAQLAEKLSKNGAVFSSSLDSEVFGYLYGLYEALGTKEAIFRIMTEVKGAYSVVLLTPERILAFRDPLGFRPLCLGKVGDAIVIASESCALDLIEAESLGELKPGELLEVSKEGVFRTQVVSPQRQAACIFELIYFSRPDSTVFHRNVYEVRKAFGKRLFEEDPIIADMVIPVPDSGVPAAIGYHQASGIPFEMGLIRNHYIGRTFIEPKQAIRSFGVKVKLNPLHHTLKDKRLVLIDDSIVRGTTLKKIVALLRGCGVKEVHVRISSPPIVDSCYFGIDTPSREELLASRLDIPETGRFLKADSLNYLSIEGMLESAGMERTNTCLGRFTGRYPLKIDERA